MSEYLITGRHFLIVEDNLLNRNITQTILMNYGAHVELARDGREAIEKVQSSNYDIILLDIMLPDMNGYEVAKRIRQLDGCDKDKLKIIALTATDFVEEHSKYLNGFLRKPFTIHELASILK